MAHRIAVLSRKGGVGKSTITNHLAHGLALCGRRVLVLEIEDNTRLRKLLTGDNSPLDDSQTTYSLFTKPELGIGRAAYQIDEAALLARAPNLSKQAVAELAGRRGWHKPQPFDFVPGSQRLRTIENRIAFAQSSAVRSDFDPYTQLARALEVVEHRGHYDVILMDTPPSLSTIQTNVLMAAGSLIYVIDFDADSMDDYQRTDEFYRNSASLASQLGRPIPAVLGVVYNRYDATFEENDVTLLRAYTEAHYEGEHGDKLVGPLVPYPNLGVIPDDRKRLTGSVNKRISLHTWAPTSVIGEAMWLLTANVQAALAKLPAGGGRVA